MCLVKPPLCLKPFRGIFRSAEVEHSSQGISTHSYTNVNYNLERYVKHFLILLIFSRASLTTMIKHLIQAHLNPLLPIQSAGEACAAVHLPASPPFKHQA